MADLTTAVEAGARAWYDQQRAGRRLNLADDAPAYDDIAPLNRHVVREYVLPIVTAVVEAIESEEAR